MLQNKIFATCVVSCLIAATSPLARSQLSLLSSGNPAKEWRTTQLAQLDQQLDDGAIQGALRQELLAQKRWLASWTPGSLSEQPQWEPPESMAPKQAEPIVDPEGRAAELRERLFGEQAHPTIKDTQKLQSLLLEYPEDIGLRQLHLQWLDQRQYRKTYPVEISDTALQLFAMLGQLSSEEENIQVAQAYCLYRRTRALAYRELPDVVTKKPIEDPEKFEGELIGAYNQLISVAGAGRPEFILVEIRMLRRDRFYGRALVLLTDYAEHVEPEWFLKKRRDLLRELGWEAPAKEAAAIYAEAFPQAAEAEAEE